ncbi:MAG: T9SS type A sorting domain-containing protein [Ferruginibacter sp.]
MKIFTLTIVMLFTCITNFAQTSTNCPSYFKRNNGGCNGQAMLKIYYASCPQVAPIIDSVYHSGQKLTVTFALPDYSNCSSAGYISYCVNGGNLPTVGALQIFYHTPGASFNCNVLEGTLPVKYLSFDAVVNERTVLLKWLTTQEVNNSHFEVERSFDMNTYSNVGIVLDGFVNGTNKSYQFKDNSSELQSRSIVYYRLKQFDIDGKFTYSKVLAVRLSPAANTVMQVSPNPFIENLNVRFTATEPGVAQIRIINATGQTLLSKQTTISKGYNNIQVDGLRGLATGMYVAQLIMNGTVIDNQRVIKNPF